jgi:hypothetical protein
MVSEDAIKDPIKAMSPKCSLLDLLSISKDLLPAIFLCDNLIILFSFSTSADNSELPKYDVSVSKTESPKSEVNILLKSKSEI